MDDEALDELEGQLASLREQALEQIALSQKLRLELEQRAAGSAPVRSGALSRSRPRRPSGESVAPASAPVPSGASSWPMLGARLRHRMRLV
ncbi:MAG: hypothetical protein ACRYHA_34655 [Janthinobacterium lividum]